MSKGAPSPPSPMNPTQVIGAQENSNIDTAMIQQLMNMMGTSNPFGSTSYKQTGSTSIDGHDVPQYSQTQSLSPEFQSLMGQFQNLAGNSSPMSLSDPKLLQGKVSNAIYNQATSRLDPQWQATNAKLADTLANQGIMPGTSAYDHAMQDNSMAQNDAYTSANNAATAGGEQAASQLFGEQLAGHQQGVSDMNAPISALSQIMAAMRGQTTPQTGVSGTDVSGIYSNYQNQLNQQYQAQMQQYGAQMGGIGSLLGSAAQMIPFF